MHYRQENTVLKEKTEIPPSVLNNPAVIDSIHEARSVFIENLKTIFRKLDSWRNICQQITEILEQKLTNIKSKILWQQEDISRCRQELITSEREYRELHHKNDLFIKQLHELENKANTHWMHIFANEQIFGELLPEGDFFEITDLVALAQYLINFFQNKPEQSAKIREQAEFLTFNYRMILKI